MGLFVEVAQQGSFSAAGRRVGRSPSSVSRQIDGLEHALSVRLFHRTTRALRLTEAGEVLLGRASTLIEELEQLREELLQHALAPRGLLRIGAPASLGQRHLVPALPRLLERYPQLRVEVSLNNRRVDPVSEGIDLLVRIGHLRDSSLIARRLADHPRFLVASPAYLERRGRPRRLADLSGHDCLLYRYDTGSMAWRFRRGGELRRIEVSGRFAADNADALLEICRQGLGIALLPAWMMTAELERGDLVRLLPGFEATATDFDVGIFALYPSATHTPAKLRVGLQFLVEIFSGPPWR